MDPWNQGQRMRGNHQQPGFPQHANLSQNYFQPGNPQQLYSGQQGVHGHPASFQAPRGIYPMGVNARGMNPRTMDPRGMNPRTMDPRGMNSRTMDPRGMNPRTMDPRGMNPMQGHVMPPGQAAQMQFTQADMEEMKKKRHFEEQQRRLMALKQKGGAEAGKLGTNPLNNLFGRKGNNPSNTSSLLGTLGDPTKPRSNSYSTSGSSLPAVQARPVTSNVNVHSDKSSNRNLQGMSSHTTSLPGQHGGSSLPGQHGGSSLPGQHGGSSLPGQHGGSSVPGQHGGSSVPGSHGGSSVPGQHGGSSVPGSHGGSSVPGQHGGSSVPGQHGGSSVPGQHGGSSLPRQHGGSSVPGQHGGSSVPGQHGGSSVPGSHGGSSVPGQHGGSSVPGSHGGSSVPGSHGGSSIPGQHGGSSVPGSHGGSSVPGQHGGSSVPGSHGGSSVPGQHGGSSVPGSHGGSSIPGQHGGSFVPGQHGGSFVPGSHGGSSVPDQHGGSFVPGQHSGSSVPGSHHAGSFFVGQQTGNPAFTRAKAQEDFGDFQYSATNQPVSNNGAAPLSVATVSAISTSGDGTDVSMSKPDRVSQTAPGNQSIATATPSIEELMKKSMSLDNQPQGPGKKFHKPKLPRMVKSGPVHFTESAKASKWDNLESLSDVFTIPQAAMTQPEQGGGTDLVVDDGSDDDWSDFSGADQHGVVLQGTIASPQASSELLPSNKPESSPLSYGHHTHLSGETSSPQMNSGLHSGTQASHQQPPITLWSSQATGMMAVAPASSHPCEFRPVELETSTGNEHLHVGETAVQQGADVPDVDPEQQIYGVTLPGWSKETSSLPAVYKQVYKICSKDGGISTSQLYPILLSSGLPRDKLGHIWSQCNKAMLGHLNEQELYLILGMVALAQVGLQLSKITLGKLASCTTPPIPSFPEHIFQNDNEPVQSTVSPPQSTSGGELLEDKNAIQASNEDGSISTAYTNSAPYTNPSNLAKHIDAVKQPDWSKWKTSKAANIDDKFTDFQALVPKDRSGSFQEQANLVLSNKDIGPSLPDPAAAFASGFQPTTLTSQTQSNELVNHNATTVVPTTDNSAESFLMAGSAPTPASTLPTTSGTHPAVTNVSSINSFPGHQSSTMDDGFGDFTSSEPRKNNFVETKSVHTPSNLMSVPLAQRYTLTDEDENIDQHEKAWLKCLTSCYMVMTQSHQILQTIKDPQLMNEIFSSQQAISHFSAIIEIYCVSQRIQASVLKSAPNNVKLKEALQNIDNVWKTCLGFPSFKALLPTQSLNFSGCHVNENEDLKLTCGVCLLNVDKSWVKSLVNNGRSGKLSYGSRSYHTTCANFWCNKVDSVLPALQLNVGNSLI